MAFGQQSGPPATHRQVQQLTELLQAAGHSDFRDARHPLGLTQRQAGGKFTRDEAADLIARLEAEAEEADAAGPAGGSPRPAPAPPMDRRAEERANHMQKIARAADGGKGCQYVQMCVLAVS